VTDRPTPHQVVRFVVGSRDGRRAITWRCWIPGGDKSDVYLAPRPIADAFKVSLHESGDWRLAFAEQFEKKLTSEGRWREGESRKVAQWPRSTEIAPGCTLAFRVLVPASAVTIGADPDVLPNDLVWINPPAEERAVEVALIITEPRTPVDGWPGRRAMGTQLVGSLSLPTGETAWIVHREVDIPTLAPAKGSVSRFDPESSVELGAPDHRVIITIQGEDGRPEALMECKFAPPQDSESRAD